MRIFNLALLALLFISSNAVAKDNKTRIFACEPEWASLAQEIGGDKVEVFSATTAKEDPHHIRAKPSLIAAMRKSDFVICSGASLEVGWLPILLENAGNSNVQPGGIAFLEAASIFPMLDKPTSLDRSNGDVHPEGNPHVHLNPHNISLVAKEFVSRLKQVDSANSEYYQSRYSEFSNKWQQAIVRWEKEAATLKGTAIVAHHASFAYLNNWLGLKQLATLEPKPGIPPSTAHLESLLKTLQAKPAQAILRTPYEPENAAKWLAEKTGKPVIELPYSVGGNSSSEDLFSLFENTITLLKEKQSAK